MIHIVRSALWSAANAQKIPGDNLRSFKTINRSDWELIPIKQLPSLSFEWGGGLNFEGFTNPLSINFDISAVIKSAAVGSPDEGSEELLKLLWDMDTESEWGLVPFLLETRNIQLPGTPYTVLLTPKVGEPIAEKLETNQYTFSCLTLIQCQIQRDPRYMP